MATTQNRSAYVEGCFREIISSFKTLKQIIYLLEIRDFNVPTLLLFYMFIYVPTNSFGSVSPLFLTQN